MGKEGGSSRDESSSLTGADLTVRTALGLQVFVFKGQGIRLIANNSQLGSPLKMASSLVPLLTLFKGRCQFSIAVEII